MLVYGNKRWPFRQRTFLASVLSLLVEVGLWLFTFDGGVQPINIFLCVEALGVLHCIMSLQMERKHEIHPKTPLHLASGTHPRIWSSCTSVSPIVSLGAKGYRKMDEPLLLLYLVVTRLFMLTQNPHLKTSRTKGKPGTLLTWYLMYLPW